MPGLVPTDTGTCSLLTRDTAWTTQVIGGGVRGEFMGNQYSLMLGKEAFLNEDDCNQTFIPV